MPATAGPHAQNASGHSRESSGASSASAPTTPTFSTATRSHNRWPSSTSSSVSVSDAQANINKSALHDLVEDPAEREDSFDLAPPSSRDEPLCICMIVLSGSLSND
ncbi:Only proline and serine are matching in the corresponding protein [Teratosphaeria destructans]|uniref:Only proline and serine are matching in the corresponding protein n=1 Tax=Teratosphaeria destructans TaxID=418781 RepID=A0A9W7SJZ9_9PEZI|nr:Only proline and serine are matching in the corresponding protein [Teratosphaeria destructans]